MARHHMQLNRLMLDKRYRYIAERIDETLQVGETRLIFLGPLHSLKGRPARDIQVTRMSGHLEVPGKRKGSTRKTKRDAQQQVHGLRFFRKRLSIADDEGGI